MISKKIPEQELRKKKCLNGLWNFKCETDNEWTDIKVPSCYSIQRDGGKWDRFYWDSFGYPKRWSKKGGTYRIKFDIPVNMKGMKLRFACQGAFYNSSTYINNKKVGEFDDGYFPFEYFLTDEVNDRDNILKVKISEKSGKTNGGESVDNRGIWQDTYLKAYPEIFIENNSWIWTSYKNNKIHCQLPVRNCSEKKQKIFIRNFITDKDGQIVKIFDGGWHELVAGEVQDIKCSDKWQDPHLWFPHDPYLYKIHTVIYNEKELPVDKKVTRFAFREISWQGHHLYINDRELFLRGHGGHYCGDLQGTKKYAKKWLQSLQEKGINFMRLHIYPKHHVLYEAADEVGFLLEAEAAFHFRVPEDKEFAKKHIERLIKNQRNHPSVIMYSVSNELRWRGGGEKKYLIDHARKIDHTRPVFASDFSGWSIHGDLLGHHYNGDSVFSEWQEYGPDKAMIWDEVGNVWQPERPLDNGPAGYEVSAQDYATGLWRDGHDEMLKNLKNIEKGEMINGELHRVNAKVPWDLSYNFFRFQPINNHQTLHLEWDDLNKSGIKQNFIKSCSSTLNIWDDNLPVLQANPGFYIFSKYMQAVRFWPTRDKDLNINYTGKQQIAYKFDITYEDTRLVDKLSCKVVTKQGKVLSKKDFAIEIRPGEVKKSVEIDWQLPEVKEITEVNFVREFSYKGKPGYSDKTAGKLFPEFNSGKIKGLKSKKIVLYDPAGKTAKIFKNKGIKFEQLSSLDRVKYPDIDILIIGENNDVEGLNKEFVKKGGRVICLRQNNEPKLPVNLPSLVKNKNSVRYLLNGARHFVLDKLGQQDFYYWGDEAIDKAYLRPIKRKNFRIILAGDKDGASTSLFEIMQGKGTYIFCQLKIVDSIIQEPVAGHLLHNMLQYVINYQPAKKPGLSGLLTTDTEINNYFKNLGLLFDELKPDFLPALDQYSVLIVDGQDSKITSKISSDSNKEKIKTFLATGGKIMVLNINEKAIAYFNKLLSKNLFLSEPYSHQTSYCIKAAISWTRRNTPASLVQYYDDILIPQPFEANKDRLLSGISNLDLNWDGRKIFNKGIKFTGINPVYADCDYNILISNWKIDWSRPVYGGEYIHESKDIRRANWFLNRDPVVLKIKERKGYFLFNQMNLLNGGKKGRRITSQLLTQMGASIGTETYFNTELDYEKQQSKEVLQRQKKLKIPDSIEISSYADSKLNKKKSSMLSDILIIGDEFARGYIDFVENFLKERAEVVSIIEKNLTTEAARERMQAWLEINDWDIIYLNIGLEDIRHRQTGETKDNSNNIISAEKFQKNIIEIVEKLKNTDVKIFWSTIPAIPDEIKGWRKEDLLKYNRMIKEILNYSDVYINDIYSIITDFNENLRRKESVNLSKKGYKLLGKLIGEAIQYFGV